MNKIRKLQKSISSLPIHVELANFISKQKRKYSKIPPESAKKIAEFVQKKEKPF